MNTDKNHVITEEEHRRICDYMAQLKEYQAKTADLDLSSADSIKDWESRACQMLEWLGDAATGEYAIIQKYQQTPKEAPPEVMDAFITLQAATMDLAKNIAIASDKLYKLTGIPREEQESLKGKETTEKKAANYKQLPQVRAPQRYGIMYDKLSRNIVSKLPTIKEINGDMCMIWSVNQAEESHEQIATTILLSRKGDNKVTLSDRIDGIDEAIVTAIANIIYSMRAEGYSAPYQITPAKIWRTMNGIQDYNAKTPDNIRKLICDRIDKMRFIDMTIDVREELAAGRFHDDDNVKDGFIKDNYIHARWGHAVTMKNRIIDCYEFFDVPYIYTYNEIKGNLSLVDSYLLETGRGVNDSIDMSVFRLYLLGEIDHMYTGYRKSTRILYKTMYRATGWKTPAERVAQREYKTENSRKAAENRMSKDDREKVNSILNTWKDEEYILDFSPVKDGRTFTGIDIILNRKKVSKKNQVRKR